MKEDAYFKKIDYLYFLCIFKHSEPRSLNSYTKNAGEKHKYARNIMIKDIKMGIEMERESAKWLEGVVDCHVHLGPDLSPRQFDVIEFAKQARAVGYAGFIAKAQTYNNAPVCALASKIVPGIGIYGGIVLNWQVGGLSPEAVEACLIMGGKEVWLGNMHLGKLRNRGMTETTYERESWPPQYRDKAFLRSVPAINMLNEEGKILPEVLTILDLIAEYDAILGTGHISKEECFAIVPEARRRGVKRIAITHPRLHPSDPGSEGILLDPEEQRKIVELGAKLGLSPPTDWTAKNVADAVRNVGADNCVAGSRTGHLDEMHPISIMNYFMRRLVRGGIPLEDVLKIFVDNGQWLVGLR